MVKAPAKTKMETLRSALPGATLASVPRRTRAPVTTHTHTVRRIQGDLKATKERAKEKMENKSDPVPRHHGTGKAAAVQVAPPHREAKQ